METKMLGKCVQLRVKLKLYGVNEWRIVMVEKTDHGFTFYHRVSSFRLDWTHIPSPCLGLEQRKRLIRLVGLDKP